MYSEESFKRQSVMSAYVNKRRGFIYKIALDDPFFKESCQKREIKTHDIEFGHLYFRETIHNGIDFFDILKLDFE